LKKRMEKMFNNSKQKDWVHDAPIKTEGPGT